MTNFDGVGFAEGGPSPAVSDVGPAVEVGRDAPVARPRPEPPAADPHLEHLSHRYAQTRDPASREMLILHHQKLVYYVASRFIGSGESLEDLVQVGNIGLINALDRYDPSKDVKFSTYALPTIVGEIKRHFRDKTWQVKVPRWLQELSINVRKSQQHLTVRLGRAPTIREIAVELSATEDRVLEALEITHIANTISLDTRLDASSGAESATLMDIIGRPDSGLNDIDAYSDLRRAIGCLEARERQVVELRFFDDMSQAKIARELGISQMHVSRLQQRALVNLRLILADEASRPRRVRRRRRTQTPTIPGSN
jgi:RNA polymerase sigma-B factor